MREPRTYLEGAVYYTTVKAGNQELLFRDNADYAYFLDMLKERKEKYNFKLYAFCLLPNHYHLLIEAQDKNISKIMQALNTSYSLYFNNKYHRQGHLLAGRFQMKAMNKDASLLELTYHIHLNPLRLGLVKRPEEYYFSSYLEYTKDVDFSFLTDHEEIISYLGPLEDREALRIKYIEQIQEQALRIKYIEHIHEFTQENPSSVSQQQDITTLAKAEEIIRQMKLSPRILVGLSSGLLLVVGLVFLGLRTGIFKELAATKGANQELYIQKTNVVSLPEGLPIVSDSHQEKQVWEFWKN